MKENLMKLSIRPYQQGYNAGMTGKSTHTCPYEQGGRKHKQWLTGHKRGTDLVWFLSVKIDRTEQSKHARIRRLESQGEEGKVR
jgi:ribosome modulation factor